jgi:hypothetical protein
LLFASLAGTDVEVRGEWKGRSCGGCFNHRTWVNNPNIFLTVKKNCTITFSLFQPLTSESGGEKLMHHMSFYVFRTFAPQGRRQLKKVAESDIVCEGYYSNLRHNKGTETVEMTVFCFFRFVLTFVWFFFLFFFVLFLLLLTASDCDSGPGSVPQSLHCPAVDFLPGLRVAVDHAD